ncbi:hypothetical protein L3Q82_025433 [Scortum barcoo]|uniref:Uncharacterized protein n=1 Tax=Scortum barcoo TaxID=214431 RepID=A0ACB8WQQ7_9TELE|nr:hypothetical protein L3Q82_025433 [Scortum barcoo]
MFFSMSRNHKSEFGQPWASRLGVGLMPQGQRAELHQRAARRTAEGEMRPGGRRAPSWTLHCSSPTSLTSSGWMMPSSTSFTPPSLTWRRHCGSTVRIMFFDFSSAFNTIQPRLLGDKLQLAGVDHHLTSWILDYLTHRPQFVRVQGFESGFGFFCITGAPQGTVLAPFLFTLYNAGFLYNTTHHHVISRSSLMTLLLLASSQMGTTESTEDLFRTLRTGDLRNNLQINAGKTKELVVDFQQACPGQEGQQQTVPAQEAESFGVQGPLLRTFYDSVVASAIFYGIVCWASSITDRDRRRIGQTGEEGQLCPGMPPGLSGGGGKQGG